MKVILADGAGFCFGVRRAVQGALDAAKAGRVACLGEITHNRRVIENLQRAGVRVIERINEAQPGETIIIRAHGEGRAVYDALAAQNIDFIDLTCPMVAENRRRAIDAQKSAKIIIFGDKNHPEVLGILGWLDNGAIVISETNNFVDLDKKDKYFLIAQTTASAEDFNEFIHNISQIIPNLEIAGGICPETKTKQSTAKALAKTVDKMLIFGDLASSNSKKLYETCHKIQKKSYLFQTIDEIDLKSFCKGDIIGITAGASTPPDILEEAMIIMTELEKNVNGENIGETPEIAKSPPKTAAAPAPDEPENGESFEELLNESILTLHTGDIVKGTVISINNGEIMVNLGYKSDGIIQRGHYSDKTDADPAEELSPGDEIEVYVLRVNDGDGNVLLSKKRIDAQKGQLEIEKAYKEGTPLPGKITEVVNRGVIVMIKGIRA
ncbi:MAG: 4-hydroxy-3-methylbut-2-enyl diphosphate reductase, partial [Defluviitaleaceae bacterium]|nr:4-hydroxy-3-methylbut-2-enyl diphosphate reductase [Defluviitaleaceae bacterium]